MVAGILGWTLMKGRHSGGWNEQSQLVVGQFPVHASAVKAPPERSRCNPQLIMMRASSQMYFVLVPSCTKITSRPPLAALEIKQRPLATV